MFELNRSYHEHTISRNSQIEIPLRPNSHVVKIGHQICKVVASDRVPKICFGPLYSDVSSSSLVASTFDFILLKSPGENEEILQKIKAAVNNDVLRQVKLSYKDNEGLLTNMSDEAFQLKMIKEGSAMLLQSLYCLGYSDDHEEAFGRRLNDSQSLKEYFESIFFPGNQICNSVLQILLKQDFFKKIIETNEWGKPSDFFRKALYMSLLKPNINANDQVSCLDAMKTYISNYEEDVFEEEPSDVLHALHMLVVGRGGFPPSHWFRCIVDEPNFSTATDLNKKGIYFKGVEGNGIRGINFKSSLFGGVLSMPVIPADEHIGVVFEVLKDYESTENFTSENCEVTSYLGLLKDLIPTIPDTNMLARKGVIGDDPIFRNNLAAALRGMDCLVTSEHIKYVRLQVRDYSGVDWLKVLYIALKVITCLAILQTTYSILQYYKKSK